MNKLISDYEGWLHTRVTRLVGWGHPDYEDLVQEGRIAMWKALRTWGGPEKGALPTWLTIHASWAIKDSLIKKRWTGQPGHQGQKRWDGRLVSLDQLMSDEMGVELLLIGADLLDGVELAYHAGEIAAALEALTPAQKKYVVCRFWGGMVTSELKLEFGYEPHALWHSEKNGAKKKLRERLEHLCVSS